MHDATAGMAGGPSAMRDFLSMTADQPSRPAPIPLNVVTGFLGAGKTTLLNRLLRDPWMTDTIVIINEFGEIGLDHLFVEKVDEDLVLMTAGCLCCSIRGDLVATLEDLLRRRDNGRIRPFRRVVIETTGLADPAPILHPILRHPYLSMRYALDGVVTLVDAVNGEATLDAHEEAMKQAAVADCLVLTKADLLRGDDLRRLERLTARLGALNPAADVVRADDATATAERLLDRGLYSPDGKIGDVARWLGAEVFEDAHHHGHGHDQHGHHDHNHHHHEDHGQGHHQHDVNRHDARIRAFCLTSDRPIPAPSFDLFLDLLRSAHGPNLLRVKGLVAVKEEPEHPVVIHGVQHIFHPPVVLDAWPDGDRRTRIVFILRDLDESFVRRLWGAFDGTPAVDTPDAQALTDNPLAIGGSR